MGANLFMMMLFVMIDFWTLGWVVKINRALEGMDRSRNAARFSGSLDEYLQIPDQLARVLPPRSDHLGNRRGLRGAEAFCLFESELEMHALERMGVECP